MCDYSAMVSIIVPIYKVEEYLERCVRSLRMQTHRNIEIILVDDGSPDRCHEMCDKYAVQDNRIRVVHKKNEGLSAARNAGLRVATGDYLLYVDSDDYLEVDACERLLNGHVEGADIVVGAAKEVRYASEIYQKHTNLEEGKLYSAKEYIIKSIERNEWYAPAWLNLYKKDFLISNRLFFRVGYYFEDIEMLPRLFLANPKVCYMDYPFYNYVIRENSIMTSDVTDKKKQITIDIYSNWMNLIQNVEDAELKEKLYGIAVRYYIANARMRGMRRWKVDGMNFGFAMKYALSSRERIKVLFYTLLPKLYGRVANAMKGQ